MIGILCESYRVAWSDLRYLRSNLATVLVSVLVMPFLYFLTFAFGLGRYVDSIEGVSYAAFVIPGIASLSTVTSCFSSTANKIMVQRRFYSSFDEILLCPISVPAVVLGKTAVGLFKGMLCSLALLASGVLMAPDLRITPLLLATVAASCLTFSLLGVVAGMCVDGLPRMNLFNSLVILPMTFLCGTLFSVSAYPRIVQGVVDLLPLTHTTACVRAAALGWEFPWMSLIVLLAFCAAFFAINHHLVKTRRV